MSSNIQVQRICQYCSNEFTARTTVTKYCSDTCAKRAYKEREKTAKVEASDHETHRIISKPIEELKAKEFLSITEVCKLIGISRWTIWRAIKARDIKAGKIGKRRIIKRSEIDKLFDKPEPVKLQVEKQPEQEQLNETECYNLKEVQEKYGISEKALAVIIKRNNIPKVKKGWFAYVPKTYIDRIFINP